MAIREDRTPDLAFRDPPGHCPLCGAEVRPPPEQVVPVGSWSGREEATGLATGGAVYGTNCPRCGVVLRSYRQEPWAGADPAEVEWHARGDRGLVGGDRWRGRPGAWSPADAPRHEARLEELRERAGSLEEAVRILHAAAGLGALPLAGLVARVAGLQAEEAKRLVVRALARTRRGSGPNQPVGSA